jgi:NADPH:quinone reductase-like Zn-dependent oxidoreductase
MLASSARMRAGRFHSFGGPEVVQLEEVPRPEPGPNQILVRVHAAGVNPVDWKLGEGLLGPQPLPSTLGNDFSGVVEEVGQGVEQFQVGQEVFGSVADESGSYADYAVAPVSHVAEKPEGLDHFQAAALPTAGLTAWQALFDVAGLSAGQTLLIHAAAGGVGSFAVQLAKWKQAQVIGTASGVHAEFVRLLGADQVVDYRTTRFESVARDVEVVLDTIGGETQDRSWGVLKAGGILVSVVRPPTVPAGAPQDVRGVFLRSNHGRSDELTQIAHLVVNGHIRVFVQNVLPLDEAPYALEMSRRGHAVGKTVLRVI